MGCGASRSVIAGDRDGIATPIAGSTTHIRDIAPPEVADTGAYPPRAYINRELKTQTHWTRGTEISPPGTVPDFTNHGSELVIERGSLIRKHPPKKPQRLEEQPMAILSANTLRTKEKTLELKIQEEEESQDVHKTKDGQDVASTSEPL